MSTAKSLLPQSLPIPNIAFGPTPPRPSKSLAAAIEVPALPQRLLPVVGVSSNLTEQQLQVLGAWHSLYHPESEAQQAAALKQQYDSAARFEDNFVQVGMCHLWQPVTVGWLEVLDVQT
jgi:hypothetical protein